MNSCKELEFVSRTQNRSQTTQKLEIQKKGDYRFQRGEWNKKECVGRYSVWE